MPDESQQRRRSPGNEPEDQPDEPGAEGGSQSPTKDKLPFAPAEDDTPVGDTDQHSTG